MALIACAECGHQISSLAATCPQCGAPVAGPDATPAPAPAAAAAPRKSGWFGKTVLALLGLFAFIMVIGSSLPETPRSRARDTCSNIERQAYTPSEKARAAEVCGMLMKEADKQMGIIPR